MIWLNAGKRRRIDHGGTMASARNTGKGTRQKELDGLNFGQMFSVLVDVYDQCPECTANLSAWSSDVDAAKAEDVPENGDAGDTMAQLEAALDMIRSAFLSLSSEGSEDASLREQLARSQAETRKAEETYRRKLRAIAAQLQDLA